VGRPGDRNALRRGHRTPDTGLIVVGFTLLAKAASHAYSQLQQWGGEHGPCLVLLWTPLLTVGPL
jgi:hypothetical protein